MSELKGSQPLETTLTEWWRQLLAMDQIGLDDDFFELGGDSLTAVRLFTNIKTTYNVNLAISTMFEAPTIRDLAATIQSLQEAGQVGDQPAAAVVPIQKKGSGPPLFMISGLGGNVLNFRDLALHLGEDSPLFALQPQGLNGSEPFLTRVEDMAEYYIKEMRKIQPCGPYFLAGYSFGGIVAFEIAQRFMASGEKMAFLGLLDTAEYNYIVSVKESLSPSERATLYKSRINALLFGQDSWQYLKNRLSVKAYIAACRLCKIFGRSEPNGFGDIQNINSYAGLQYCPKMYSGPVSIFRTSEREVLEGNDPLLGWGPFIGGPVDEHQIPGTHFTITREPNVRVLADELRNSLDNARSTLSELPSVEWNNLAVTI